MFQTTSIDRWNHRFQKSRSYHRIPGIMKKSLGSKWDHITSCLIAIVAFLSLDNPPTCNIYHQSQGNSCWAKKNWSGVGVGWIKIIDMEQLWASLLPAIAVSFMVWVCPKLVIQALYSRSIYSVFARPFYMHHLQRTVISCSLQGFVPHCWRLLTVIWQSDLQIVILEARANITLLKAPQSMTADTHHLGAERSGIIARNIALQPGLSRDWKDIVILKYMIQSIVSLSNVLDTYLIHSQPTKSTTHPSQEPAY